MSSPAVSPIISWLARFLLVFSLNVGASSAIGSFGLPGEGDKVVYNPDTTQQQQGQQPFHDYFDLTIQSPRNLSSGAWLIQMQLIVSQAPAGVDHQVAASYITFADPITGAPKNQLLFIAPGESQVVRVFTDIPIGSDDGNFQYLVTTSGWPGQVLNDGMEINAQAALPSDVNAPTVSILTPANGTEYTYTVGGSPVPVEIQVQGTANPSAPVETLVASLSGVDALGNTILADTPLSLVLTALGQPDTYGNVVFPASQAGIYTITATTTNAVGSDTKTSTFVVVQQVPPPTVVINPPVNNPTYTYVRGLTSTSVPYSFTGSTLLGTIIELTATLDGVPFNPDLLVGVGQASNATGSGVFVYDASTLGGVGPHTLVVTAKSAYGQATTSATFVVAEVVPAIAIDITTPADNLLIVQPLNASGVNVPYAFVGTTTLGANVTGLTATLTKNGVTSPLSIETVSNLNTPAATGIGTFLNLQPGVYTLAATATNVALGLSATDSVTFTVVAPPPPVITIAINPEIEANSPYTLPATGALTIPFTFTGTITAGATVDTIVGTINGSSVSISSTTGLGVSSLATASGTLIVTEPGTYVVTATDTNTLSGLSATTSVTFVVEGSNEPSRIDGLLFFDVNFNGVREAGEYGLPGIPVTLLTAGGQTVSSTVSDANGAYSFTPDAGSYVVSAGAVRGLSFTTMADHAITLSSSNRVAPDTGYGLHFAAINGLVADGFTIGFWKNNIDKALAGKTKGVQLSAQTLAAYTHVVSGLALEPFTNLTMQAASDAMSAKGSAPATLLAKQLVASEYNYANGAYIGDNPTLTYAFIHYAEHVLKNAGSYSSSYIGFVKDWCDAYNNSHGGAISGPQP